MYEFYKSRPSEDKLKKSRKELKQLYSQVPETQGCKENIAKDGGCGAWCCETQQPQVMYVEFLNTWNHILQTESAAKIASLLLKAVRLYLTNKPTTGCMFWDKKTKLCTQHNTRPLNCFTPKTLIMTQDGTREIGTIMAGDLVYGHDGGLHRVIATNSKWHTGDIYGIRQQGTHLRAWCTDEHQWYVSTQKDKRKIPSPHWKRADALIAKRGKINGDYLTFPKVFQRTCGAGSISLLDWISADIMDGKLLPWTSGKLFEGKNIQSLPAFINLDDSFLLMLGLYLAEGNATSQSAYFSMNVRERPKLDAVAEYLSGLGIRTHWTESGQNLGLRVDSCLFGRFMKKLCGDLAPNKRIHPELFRILSPHQLWNIFLGWNAGDGRKSSGSVVYSVTTISKTLAAQMQQILLMNGIYPRVAKEHRSNRGEISYAVVVNESSMPNWNPIKWQGSKIMYDEKYIYGPMAEIVVKNYSGPVIDIQVSDSESFVTIAGSAHNCRVYAQIPEEEFKPRYERLKILYEKRPGAVIKDQCNLCTTVGEKPTKKDTDAWQLHLEQIEESIGIAKRLITDEDGGSYRKFHDHVLLRLASPAFLQELTHVKMTGTKYEKEEYIRALHKRLKTQHPYLEDTVDEDAANSIIIPGFASGNDETSNSATTHSNGIISVG